MIPDEAVEAAAKAHYGLLTWGGPDEWGFLHKQGQDELLALTRAALEAAAPHMRQTITTSAALDALGRNAAIMQPGGTVLVHDGQTEDPWGSYADDPFGGPIWTDSSHVTLPVIVLHAGDPK